MATSDVLIGSGNIVFDDGSGNTKASLFVDVNNPLDNVISFGGVNSVTACTVKNVEQPSVDTDAANKKYVDDAIASIPQTPAVGASGDVQFTDGNGNFLGEAAFNWTGTQLNVTGDIGATGIITAGTGIVATTGNVEATAGNVILPATNVNGYVESTTFRVRGPNTANYTRLTSQATSPDVIFSLPENAGSNGAFLKTNGAGSLTWEVPSGLQFSESVKAGEAPNTGANINIASSPGTIGGFTPNVNDLVILMAQTDPVENGIYVFNGTGNALTRITSGIYQAGGDVVDAVTFVEEGTNGGTSFVQTANPAIVGNTTGDGELAYSTFSTQADAGGELYSIQFANPAGVFDGSSELKWDQTQLTISDAGAGGVTTIELEKTSGNIISVTGNISATTGNVTAGATVSAGTDVIVGGASATPTTLINGTPTAIQSITLPDNSGNAADQVLVVSQAGAATITEWKDVSTITPPTQPAPPTNSIQFNFDNAGTPEFGGSTDFTWNDTTKTLSVSGGALPTGGIISATGNIGTIADITAGNNVTATAGDVSAGGSVVIGTQAPSFPTTLTTGASTAQSIALPDNSGNAADQVLVVSQDGAATTTEWKTVTDIVGAGDVIFTGTAPIQANSLVLFGSGTTGKEITGDSGVQVVAQGELVASQSLTATNGDIIASLGTVQGVTLSDGTLSCSNGTITGGVAATFSGRVTALEVKTTSDVTLKTNITPLQDPLQQIKKMEGYSYNWKHDEQGPEMFGVLAQQLEEAGLQSLVSETNNGHKCVDYNQIIPLLLGAVKQMANEIEELKRN